MNNIFSNQKKDFSDYEIIAGVDEAGRGPLAGPLVVATVILKPDVFSDSLNDSKKLSEKKRKSLYNWVMENSITYAISIIGVEEIDRLNILQATLYGMKKCVEELKVIPQIALIDGNKTPKDMNVPSKAIVKGDGHYACIAAASILAKVTRDRIMLEIDKQYPQYAFCEHKGYPTEKHIKLLQKYGVSDVHRKSYKPVKLIGRL